MQFAHTFALIVCTATAAVVGQQPVRAQAQATVQVQVGPVPQVSAEARARRFQQFSAEDAEWQRAVTAALVWLDRQRDAHGKGWSQGAAAPDRVVLQTALAALALQATGATLRVGDFKDSQREAARFLRERQGADGRFAAAAADGVVSPHAIASWAMAEMRTLSLYSLLQPTTAKGADAVLATRDARGCWCLDQEPDAMATAMNLVALSAAGSLPHELQRASSDWLRGMTAANGRVGWRTPGGPPPASLSKGQSPSPLLETATAVGLYARLLCGDKFDAPRLPEGLDLLRHAPPRWDEKAGCIDPIYWCFGARVAYRAGGDCWLVWQQDLKRELLKAQVATGDDAGSWPPLGPWGEPLGRVGTTALIVLALTAPCTEPEPPAK